MIEHSEEAQIGREGANNDVRLILKASGGIDVFRKQALPSFDFADIGTMTICG